MVEPCGGRIFVDGLDIGAMGLHEVRRAIALIPQKAELMAGTIRSNLDPEGKFTSGEIWEAMKKVCHEIRHLLSSPDWERVFSSRFIMPTLKKILTRSLSTRLLPEAQISRMDRGN